MMTVSVADASARLADVKKELEIAPAQETAWKAYEQAAVGQLAMRDAHRQAMMNGPMPPAPSQRAAMYQQGTAARQQTADATEALYQVLTPEQKTKADNLLMPCPGLATGRMQ